jgi:hypothetical protein
MIIKREKCYDGESSPMNRFCVGKYNDRLGM